MHVAMMHQRSARQIRISPMRRRRARTLRLLALLVVLAGVLVVAPRAVYTMGRSQAPVVTTHIVASGETLWEIASIHSNGGDVRKAIFAIKQANDLRTATLQPGQTLLIPQSAKR